LRVGFGPPAVAIVTCGKRHELLSEARDHVRQRPKDAESIRRVITDAVFALARIAGIDEDLTTKIVDDMEDLGWPFAAAPKRREINDEKRTNAEGNNARFEKTTKSRFELSVKQQKCAVLVVLRISLCVLNNGSGLGTFCVGRKSSSVASQV